MSAPADGVEENEGEDASLEEDEGEEDDDGELHAVALDGIVERGRSGGVI